jgi:glutathione peroxidase
MNVYDFTARSIEGQEVSLEQYRGQVLLIVNTAPRCGFAPQYEGLEKLYEELGDRGFVVLDFPCNQFMNQAPGSDEELKKECTLNFGTKFPMFAKIKVNGKDAHPLYEHLREKAPEDRTRKPKRWFAKALQRFFPSNRIKWNFTKFLIDREGNVVERYAPSYKPEDIRKDIEAIL